MCQCPNLIGQSYLAVACAACVDVPIRPVRVELSLAHADVPIQSVVCVFFFFYCLIIISQYYKLVFFSTISIETYLFEKTKKTGSGWIFFRIRFWLVAGISKDVTSADP